MKHLLLGILLALAVAFPHLAGQGAALIAAAAVWAVGQPLVAAFAAGVIARPRLAHLIHRKGSAL